MNGASLLHRPRPGTRAAQRGVVLLFALIALVIMLLGCVALTRSFNATLFNAGNIAFKRDLMNQSERAIPIVQEAMLTGALSTSSGRATHVPASNYSATMLPTNAHGIPTVLLASDTDFSAVGAPSNDISVPDQGVSVRFVIDRLCHSVGDESTLGAGGCIVQDVGLPAGTCATCLLSAEVSSSGGVAALPTRVVYRVSVRVHGPRRTQGFYQTTFTL
jgi:hypothetical protein